VPSLSGRRGSAFGRPGPLGEGYPTHLRCVRGNPRPLAFWPFPGTHIRCVGFFEDSL